MADGEILIKTKIETDDAKDDLKKLKRELEDAAEEASESAKKTEKAFDDVEISDSIGDETKKAEKHLDDLAESAEDAGKKMGEAFPGGDLLAGFMGGIASGLTQKALDLLADAGEALVEFGMNAIELGSDLQEVQNVVDVTFTNMSDDVNQFARDAAKSAGLSETMAKKYVGTFGSMAKSMGFAEAEAFDMSTTLTQLTGDIASFYNLDQEEAYTKLKSVFTGETESLKELGVVMTQTALDAYAMENGFGKVTSEMSEQEKTALRYRFVLDQLGAASGDFVRTQDSWANQTRILSLQWESFQATIGEGLIAVFTPALEFLNTSVMPALQTVADWFADAFSPDPPDNLAASLDALGIEMGETITNAQGVAVSHNDLSAAIDATRNSVENLKQEYNAARDAARESIGNQIGLFTELKEKSDKSARDIVNNWKKQQEALQNYSANMQKAINMGLDEALVKQLSDGSEESMLILDELVNGTGTSVSEINAAFQGVEKAKDTVASTMAEVQTDVRDRLQDIADDVEDEWGDMADVVGEAIWDMQDYIDSLTGKTVYIDVVERYSTSGGPTSSSSSITLPGLSRSADYSVNTASYIPYLATGAVIPPNAPFTAVLGDQRNGYNLEGPEDMFRSIVREEIENSQDNATTELLSQILTVISSMNIDGWTLFDIVNKKQNERNVINGGSN